MKKVLVIAAHPDDELLGCGGAILRHSKNGDEVYALICCEGESVRYELSGFQYDYTEQAAKILNISRVFRLDQPDQKLDGIPLIEVIQPIEKVIEEVQPNIIYTHYGRDSNQDHRVVFDATLVAARPTWSFIEEIYSFYTVSSTEWGITKGFEPDVWIDISKEIEEKLLAFSQYQSEIRDYPHPRSIEAVRNVARYFGNQCLLEYAEAFITVRRVIR